MDAQVIVIGAGLSGLSCALRLADQGVQVLVLEANAWVGGRTASWNQDGMPVESGLHRVFGNYREWPDLLKLAGLDVNDITIWLDEIEIRVPDGGPCQIFGASPWHAPLRTLQGILSGFLTPREKLQLAVFFAAGTRDLMTRARDLDQKTLAQYATEHGLAPRTIEKILEPFTAGVLFLPPERFSAYVFFRLILSFSPRSTTLRIGAFAGGMSEVMADPLAEALRRRGSEVRTGVQVAALLVENGKVTGVETTAGPLRARHVVLATSLAAAQRVVRASLASWEWFAPMLQLATQPAISVQLQLDSPALKTDRICFGPGTLLACFEEQSRTTFKVGGGRLSLFLPNPDRYLHLDSAVIVERVIADARRLGMDLEGRVQDYRVIRHEADFHCLEPGHNHLRPGQQTPVPGFTLAGDYTRHRFPATMEGATLSGRRAAKVVQRALQEA